MKKTKYTTPQLFSIQIDRKISLRLQSIETSTTLVLEPGNGTAGAGGTADGTGTGWERVGIYENNLKTPMWQNNNN
jgi:hypothetical protein